MPAQTLNCPMCGAPVSSDAPLCEHCGARLATVACPSCFGLVFQGAKFCPHCGAKLEHAEVSAAATQLCPRCKVPMNAVVVGKTHLRECPHCEGIWADTDSLAQICADREQQAAVLGTATPLPEPGTVNLEKDIRYLPCPVCQKLMNRVNFAHCSGVVVDVCKAHGTWFDRDELRHIVEFIRAGGLETAREKQIAELQEEQHELKQAQMGGAWDSTSSGGGWNYDSRHTGISAVASVLRSFFE